MTSVSVDQSGVFTPLAASLACDDVVDVADIESFAALDAFVSRDRVVLKAASCSDGRVFGLARQLRRRGFGGALVVEANLLPDQLPMATSSGVDAIVISEAHALRCEEPQWRLKAQGERFGYQRATARNRSSEVG
jgi:uncharacterized protein (DUF934 family)